MNPTKRWPIALGIVAVFVLISVVPTDRSVSAQTHRRVFVTRLHTGLDNQTHAEDIEMSFTAATVGFAGSDVSQLMKISGAEIHRTPAGAVQDWHPASRRQYVILLSGREEFEVAGGNKVVLEPGHILLAEDTTGKGHISRVVGPEDLVTLWLPLAEQTVK